MPEGHLQRSPPPLGLLKHAPAFQGGERPEKGVEGPSASALILLKKIDFGTKIR